jgi:hypothetical protein
MRANTFWISLQELKADESESIRGAKIGTGPKPFALFDRNRNEALARTDLLSVFRQTVEIQAGEGLKENIR